MKKLSIILISIVIIISCATPLYNWENYEKTSYLYLKNADSTSIQGILETYQKIIDNPKKSVGGVTPSRGVVPPGIYADYGFVLLQEGKTEKGKTMLLKEIESYPESKVFIEKILEMVE